MDVDPARRDQKPFGVNRLPGRAVDVADLGDQAVYDRDIRTIRRLPGAIDDGAPFNDGIEYQRSFRMRRMASRMLSAELA